MQSVWIGITNTKSENNLINEIGITIKNLFITQSDMENIANITQPLWRLSSIKFNLIESNLNILTNG